MLCGLFDGVCCLPAPVSDPDTGPTGGIITQESALALNAALSCRGEGLKHHVMEETWRTHLQRKNRLMQHKCTESITGTGEREGTLSVWQL